MLPPISVHIPKTVHGLHNLKGWLFMLGWYAERIVYQQAKQ